MIGGLERCSQLRPNAASLAIFILSNKENLIPLLFNRVSKSPSINSVTILNCPGIVHAPINNTMHGCGFALKKKKKRVSVVHLIVTCCVYESCKCCACCGFVCCVRVVNGVNVVDLCAVCVRVECCACCRFVSAVCV